MTTCPVTECSDVSMSLLGSVTFFSIVISTGSQCNSKKAGAKGGLRLLADKSDAFFVTVKFWIWRQFA